MAIAAFLNLAKSNIQAVYEEAMAALIKRGLRLWSQAAFYGHRPRLKRGLRLELQPYLISAAISRYIRPRLKRGSRRKGKAASKTRPKVQVFGCVLNAATVLTLGHVLNAAIGLGLGPRLKSAAVDRSVLQSQVLGCFIKRGYRPNGVVAAFFCPMAAF